MRTGHALQEMIEHLKKLHKKDCLVVQIADGDFPIEDPDELHQLHTWWLFIRSKEDNTQ